MFTMSSVTLQAAHGLATTQWSSIDWAACRRTVRSLQRRIVKALRAGNWRKVKRLCFLLVNSFAARVLGVKRVTENAGKKDSRHRRRGLDQTEPKDASRRDYCAVERIPAHTPVGGGLLMLHATTIS